MTALSSAYGVALSSHLFCPSVSILEVIHLSELVGSTPETTIIGVEPKSLAMGLELSPEVAEKLPKVIELVLEEVNQSS